MFKLSRGRVQADETHLVGLLRLAALSAIATFEDLPERPGRTDPNPHTRSLTAYDLGRLFTNAPGDRDNVIDSLDGIANVIRLTSGSERAAARARWVAHELNRLGADQEAQRFAQMTLSAATE